MQTQREAFHDADNTNRLCLGRVWGNGLSPKGTWATWVEVELPSGRVETRRVRVSDEPGAKEYYAYGCKRLDYNPTAICSL